MTTQLGDYFDPRLLRDLATDLKIPVIGSPNDGLHDTFNFEKGESDFPKDIETDHSSMHQRLDQLLWMIGSDMLKNVSNQLLPDVLFMDEAEFNQQMTEYETRHKPHQILQIT